MMVQDTEDDPVSVPIADCCSKDDRFSDTTGRTILSSRGEHQETSVVQSDVNTSNNKHCQYCIIL